MPARRLSFFLAAYAFAVTMLGTTLPTPLYGLYRVRFGFSELMITVIFATYAVGVIAALLLFGRMSDVIGRKAVLLPGLACSAVPRQGPPRLAPQALRVPPEIRAVFVRSALAGFAGFAVLGLFTAVSPAFLTTELGVRSRGARTRPRTRQWADAMLALAEYCANASQYKRAGENITSSGCRAGSTVGRRV